MSNILNRLAGALAEAADPSGAETSTTAPAATGGPSWCRTSIVARVKAKVAPEIEALRKWVDEFRDLERSFDGIQPSTAGRRVEAILGKLSEAANGEEFRELSSELRLVELAKGPNGGRLRSVANQIVARKFAEAGPLIEALVAAAGPELEKLGRDAAARQRKAAEAVRDELGETVNLTGLSRKVDAARSKFESLRTEFSTQYNRSHWDGRAIGFLDWVLA